MGRTAEGQTMSVSFLGLVMSRQFVRLKGNFLGLSVEVVATWKGTSAPMIGANDRRLGRSFQWALVSAGGNSAKSPNSSVAFALFCLLRSLQKDSYHRDMSGILIVLPTMYPNSEQQGPLYLSNYRPT